MIAAIESNVPDLVTARTLIDDFQQMIRPKAVTKLDAWLEGAEANLVGSLANGVEKDSASVRNKSAVWTKSQGPDSEVIDRELVEAGASVHRISPALIDTTLAKNLSDETRQATLNKIPMSRMG
ncbi:hypothetical protein HNQ96_004979 [Aminobacter lissarensis]|uniref:Uncharacterized protein n=1 Tax=Aminobacter carboxidus TaxID=376165 RepID=A0A8E2BGB5_9HYPH|nr:hypothetical protein [Aminobacter lissarensis]MBB6469090.1 hypothetical protein [Aminobacter lissarensis]